MWARLISTKSSPNFNKGLAQAPSSTALLQLNMLNLRYHYTVMISNLPKTVNCIPKTIYKIDVYDHKSQGKSQTYRLQMCWRKPV